MIPRLEAHMAEPVSRLMIEDMGADVIAREFSAGYGIADLVGASMSEENCEAPRVMGLANPLDHRHYVEVLLALRPGTRRSLAYLLSRIPFSETTLRKKVLVRIEAWGLIKRESNGHVRLAAMPPRPTQGIVAIELKQTRWREALIQARRYTFFADQTYIAIWKRTAQLVDRMRLYRLRIGLIGVELDGAEILIRAPRRKPRDMRMSRYCAEFLYRESLNLEHNLSDQCGGSEISSSRLSDFLYQV